MERAIALGFDETYVIHTPLMDIDKAKTWALARRLGGDRLVDLIREDTVTCYRGERERRHEWGYGCDACPACELRASGYYRYRQTLTVQDLVR
jgi:7-cyano-7-deazaguanine synthase